MQEIVELVVFALIAVLVGTGVLWLVGWLIGLVGSLFMWLAGILWLVLRYIVPVVVIIGAAYFLFKLLQNRNQRGGGSAGGSAKHEPVVSGPRSGGSANSSTGSGSVGSSSAENSSVQPAAAPITTPQTQGLPYNPDGPAAAVNPDAHHAETSGPIVVPGTADKNDTPVEIVDPEPVEPPKDDQKQS